VLTQFSETQIQDERCHETERSEVLCKVDSVIPTGSDNSTAMVAVEDCIVSTRCHVRRGFGIDLFVGRLFRNKLHDKLKVDFFCGLHNPTGSVAKVINKKTNS